MAIYVHQKYKLVQFQKTEEYIEILRDDNPHNLIYDIEPPYFGIKLEPEKYILLSLTFKDTQHVYLNEAPCFLCKRKLKDSCKLVWSINVTDQMNENTLSENSIESLQQEYLCPQCDEKVGSALEEYIQQYSQDLVSDFL